VDLPWLKEPAGMPFVKRDPKGRIVALFADPNGRETEEICEHDPELARFLTDAHLNGGVLTDWGQSDLSMARVLEDLIGLLIDNGAIRFDQLPEEAQKKILQRRGLRRELLYVETLFAGNDAELISADEADENERYL
jgi:hypothetical protein